MRAHVIDWQCCLHAQVDGQFMAAVLLRRRQQPGASGSLDRQNPVDLATLELAALWVDPTLEDRAEVTCCLLVFLQQYLLAWDAIAELHEGKSCVHTIQTMLQSLESFLQQYLLMPKLCGQAA